MLEVAETANTNDLESRAQERFFLQDAVVESRQLGERLH